MGIKILLADDSVTAQNMGKKILAEAGHEVVTVSNGAAAAKKIAEGSPDLVLLDVFMPGYSGLELCERLRGAAATAKLPVLLTVGRMEPYSPQDGARVKADGVIVKPFEASDLIAAVDRLAQKIKVDSAAPQHEPTVKIPPPQKEYERTMLLDSTQIATMLKEGAQAASGSETNAVAPVQEFHVNPPSAHVTEAAAPATPAFSEELSTGGGDSKPAGVPSYLAQYLTEHTPPKTEGLPPEPPATAEIPKYSEFDDTVVMEPMLHAPKEPKKPSWARNAADTDESSFRSRFSRESMVQHFQEEPAAEAPVASAEGLEFTAAAPVLDVPIAQVPGFESTSQSTDAPTFVMKDPAFVSDPTHATMDFPTHFGTSEASVPELPALQEPAPAPVDEFEARLNAAMSAYEQPSTESVAEAESSAASIQATPTDSAESFVARVEAAMHGFDAPADSLPEISLAEPSAPVGEMHAELTPLPLPATPEHVSPEVEFPSFHSMDHATVADADPVSAISATPELEPSFSPAASEHAEPEPLATEAIAHSTIVPAELEHHALHEPDEVVIRQMREALANFPADSSHEPETTEPLALAAAAAASAPAQSPLSPLITHEPEVDVSRAMAEVVELRSSTVFSLTSEEAHAEVSRPDANRVAAAVEKVMKRELPNLIWKIMAELDLKKRD